MKQQKQFIIWAVLLCLCVAGALSTIDFSEFHWRQRVDLEFQGAMVSSDGSVIQNAAIVVSGWKLNYLSGADEFEINHLEIGEDQYGNEMGTYTMRYVGTLIPDTYKIQGIAYNNNIQKLSSVVMYISENEDWCLAESNGNRYVASVDAEFDANEILELYAGVLP